MKGSKRVLVTALAGTASVGLLAFAAPQAMAAPANASAAYNGVCGSGFAVVNSAPIGSMGTVYLTYNKTSGENCVVTVRNTSGTAVFMSARLSITGDSEKLEDKGQFTTYAGPVRIFARNKCVDWGGTIGSVEVNLKATNCASLA